ncbi:esterase E4-like [Planococcus citri]|uniref:esterase E4-like n=1 Tax=Planococcus citri TaxID=170843 RepID=UPI0031F8D256
MEEDFIIKTKLGKIRGYKNVSQYSKQTYYSYCGVPYAKPPIEELRFQPPVPYGKWKGILDARKERDDCIHYAIIYRDIIGSEDCLYLNIHLSEYPPPKENLKSVIVHFHGGGYSFGSGNRDYYGSPDFIIHKDFVYVNFNYRLHVLGFLNLDLPECSGNAGLKDAVLALQWVKQNIQAFGGDPNNITLFGCSSSASAIHLLMMHPHHRNLFNKAIMSGSCATNPTINYCENHFHKATQLAKIMGCYETRPRKLLQFFRKQNAENIIDSLNILRKMELPTNRLTAQHNLFIPSIEKFPDGAILAEYPINLWHTIDPIPVIYGVCNIDGMQAFAQGSPIQSLAFEFKDAVRRILWAYKMDESLLQEVAAKIKAFYFPDGDINVKKCREVCEFYQDTWQAQMYMSFLDVMHNKNPNNSLYIYEFWYEGSYNIAKRVAMRHLPCLMEGADHGDDYYYFVGLNQNLNYTPNDVVIIDYMSEFFSNFAKYGNPNSDKIKGVEWKPYTPEDPSYLKFNLELEVAEGRLNDKRIKFWEELLNYIKSKCTN